MSRFDSNIILLTDSYKLSHYKQYPEGTENPPDHVCVTRTNTHWQFTSCGKTPARAKLTSRRIKGKSTTMDHGLFFMPVDIVVTCAPDQVDCPEP